MGEIRGYQEIFTREEFFQRPPTVLDDRIPLELIESAAIQLKARYACQKPAFLEFPQTSFEYATPRSSPDFCFENNVRQPSFFAEFPLRGDFRAFARIGAATRSEPEPTPVVVDSAEKQGVIIEVEQENPNCWSNFDSVGSEHVSSRQRRLVDKEKTVRPLRSKPSGAYQPMCSVDHVTGILPLSTTRFLRSAVLSLATIQRRCRCP